MEIHTVFLIGGQVGQWTTSIVNFPVRSVSKCGGALDTMEELAQVLSCSKGQKESSLESQSFLFLIIPGY